MAKKTKKKTNRLIGKKEYIFNVLSLVIVIVVGIYFGGRSFYYYNVQNNKFAREMETLNGSVINNNKITDGDGMHQDDNGHYFKGKVENNYVKFGNRLFRIIRINNDQSVKIISEDVVSVFMWGEDTNYENSNLNLWLNGSEGVYGVYYNTLPKPEKFLNKTEYSIDTLKNNKVEKNKDTLKSYLTILSIDDYSNANGKNSYLNNNRTFWLLGMDDDKNNLYVDVDGGIQEGNTWDSYGVRVVLTLKKDLAIKSGDGTKENPYVIEQGEDINYVDNYVKLGEDIWKVNYDDGTLLKMYSTKYLSDNGTYYSVFNSNFDITNEGSLPYYLNNGYWQSLSYQNVIKDGTFYTGEVSDESGNKYVAMYDNSLVCKVGLINMFDYYTGDKDNFFLMNTTSSVSSMIYVYRREGYIEEVDVNQTRMAIPVITIEKGILKSGTGSLEDPFKM